MHCCSLCSRCTCIQTLHLHMYAHILAVPQTALQDSWLCHPETCRYSRLTYFSFTRSSETLWLLIIEREDTQQDPGIIITIITACPRPAVASLSSYLLAWSHPVFQSLWFSRPFSSCHIPHNPDLSANFIQGGRVNPDSTAGSRNRTAGSASVAYLPVLPGWSWKNHVTSLPAD